VGRVNLANPSLVNVTIISLAFEIYHALKIGLREITCKAQATRRYGEIARISRKLMKEKIHSLHDNVLFTNFPHINNLNSFCSSSAAFWPGHSQSSRLEAIVNNLNLNYPQCPVYIDENSDAFCDSGNHAGLPPATLAGVVRPGGASEDIIADAQP
jgi:hypothetical protein